MFSTKEVGSRISIKKKNVVSTGKKTQNVKFGGPNRRFNFKPKFRHFRLIDCLNVAPQVILKYNLHLYCGPSTFSQLERQSRAVVPYVLTIIKLVKIRKLFPKRVFRIIRIENKYEVSVHF